MKADIAQAIYALQAGKKLEARRMLIYVVKSDPKHAQAWYLLSLVVDEQEQKVDCLQRTLRFDPDHHDAKVQLEKLIKIQTKPTLSTADVLQESRLFCPEGTVSKPSLNKLIKEWFSFLGFREHKVLEYLYLDMNQFSVDAVGRIISENSQKVLEIKKRALGKLCQPDAFAVVKPLFDWYHLQINVNSGSLNVSNIVALFGQDWEVGNISPVGVSRLLADIQDEKKHLNQIEKRNAKPVIDNATKTKEIAMKGRLSQATGELQIVDSEQDPDTVAQNNPINKILRSDPTPLAELGLSTRVYNALFRSGIKTIGQLVALSETRLWRTKNIGETALKEIQTRLREYEPKLSIPGIVVETEVKNALKISSEKPSQERDEVRFDTDEVVAKVESSSETTDENTRIVLPFALGTKPISVLGLSVRSYNVLMRSNIQTLQSLVGLSDEKLLGLRNAGIKTVNEIHAKLADFLADNNKVEDEELHSPVVLQTDRFPENQTFEDGEIEKESNRFHYWLFSFSEAKSFPSKPLDEIAIERLSLSEPVQERLLQKEVRTISDLLAYKEKFTLGSEIGRSLKDYLEWFAEQEESVWLDEKKSKGLEPLSKLRLANTTCEILIIEWLELLSDEREKQILMWRYGINSTSLTLQEIGEKLNITRERIRQIEKRGLLRLRNSYSSHGQQLLKPLTNYLIFVFKEHDGLMSELETRAIFYSEGLVTVGNVDLIGFLALLCEVDNRFQYFKKHQLFALAGFSIATITSVQHKISKILREKLIPIYREELFSKLKEGDPWRESQETVDDKFLFACLRTHPNVEELESGAYVYANTSSKRLGAIVRALREIGEPAHYSVITKKTNAFLTPDEQFTERAVHAKLGQHPDIFVWIRLRGTYGLKEWGLEQGLSYVDAIEQIFFEEGRPLTFEQVLERMPTHREHFDEGSVVITLGTHEKFKGLPNNTYGLSSWKNNMPSLDFGDMFGEQLAQRQTELDQHINRSEIDTQSEVDKIRRIGLDFFAP